MKVLVFGSYDPSYSRNRVLIRGLELAGAQIVHCNDRSRSPLKYIRLFIKHWGLRNAYDVMLVAFPGQETMLLARLLARKPLVFDAFTSHYEGYVLDRKTAQPGSLLARWYWWLDRTACRLADVVLTDTQAHADFFAQEFGVMPSKLYPVFVGTDTDVFHLAGDEPTGTFTVHFHGTVIPLQGIPYILEAVDLLKNEGITFNLIGVNHPKVPYEQLGSFMAQAHVCLGIFGDTIKTQRVIPNKVFEALAVGRPVITADTPAIRELLDDRSAVLVPSGNAQALAHAIIQLRDDRVLRDRIGSAGYEAFMRKATPAIVGEQVVAIMNHLI